MHLRMTSFCFTLVIAVFALMSTVAGAANLEDYPQFRFHSGLPGNNSGVMPDGRVGADGAVQMSIPVAYTPCEGNYVLDLNLGMINGGFTIGYDQDDQNGTLNLGIGFLRPGHGLYASHMAVSEDNEPSYQLQWQVLDEDEKTPAIAIGGLDLNNQREVSQYKKFDGGGRSGYVVATKHVDLEGDDDLYLTLGLGSGRYKGHFGGACYRFNDQLALSLEYDTLGYNSCVTYGLKGPEATDNYVMFLGVGDMSRAAYGLTYTHAH